ncbi:hypothetical protein MMC13_005951 [Lambiella insularis]|nr:hypothetical protein [Lambiella insularis]
MSGQANVPAATFFAVQWTLAGVALCFLVFRLYVRVQSYRRIYADDCLVIFAYSCLIGNNILWHTQLQAVYDSVALESGLLAPSAFWEWETINLLRSVLAFNFLFNCCLWAVKLSFLLFFWRLGQRARGHKIWWWCVLAITVAAWLVSVGDFQFACSVNSFDWILLNCSTPDSTAVEARDFRINTTMDLLTDILIITIPVLMLWNVRIPTRMKLALFGIFSLTVFTMVFALVRLLVVPTGTIATDLTWSSTWTTVEMAPSPAIIVACLGSFRQMYVNTQEKRGFVKAGSGSNGNRSTNPSRWGFLSAFRSKLSLGNSGSGSAGSSRGGLFSFLRPRTNSRTDNSSRDQWSGSHTKLNESTNGGEHRVVPLDTIYVSNDINVSSMSQKSGGDQKYDVNVGAYNPYQTANAAALQNTVPTYEQRQRW